jgi:hypothetical protein
VHRGNNSDLCTPLFFSAEKSIRILGGHFTREKNEKNDKKEYLHLNPKMNDRICELLGRLLAEPRYPLRKIHHKIPSHENINKVALSKFCALKFQNEAKYKA